MAVTIIIKALNEEAVIEAALRSALDAAALFGGEVVLADSGSTDRTVAIARTLHRNRSAPLRIIQLAEPTERSCGAGAQLAFSGVRTDFFYLMDGDMTLVAGFIAQALAWLQAHPDFAGVGGIVTESVIENEEFRIRSAAVERETHRQAGPVDRLDGGGLYRTDAIRSVSYFSDRNLASFEEFELAARLHARGWKLARIAAPAVLHFGHRGNGYRLMLSRWRSGQYAGVGQVLRASLGQPHWGFVLRHLAQIRIVGTTLAWWLALLASALSAPYLSPPLVLMPLIVLAWRRRSLRLGLYSFCYWNLAALGTISGFFKRRVPPSRELAFVEISPKDSTANSAPG